MAETIRKEYKEEKNKSQGHRFDKKKIKTKNKKNTKLQHTQSKNKALRKRTEVFTQVRQKI